MIKEPFSIGKFLFDLFTGPGSTNFELMRVLFCLAFFCYLGFEGWSVYLGNPFDGTAFAQNIATLVISGGVATAAKDFGAGKATQATSYKDLGFLFNRQKAEPDLFGESSPFAGSPAHGGGYAGTYENQYNRYG